MVEEGLENFLALKERIRRANALAAGAALLPGDFALQGFQLFNEPGLGLVLVFLTAFLGACHSKPSPADQILLNDTTNVQA